MAVYKDRENASDLAGEEVVARMMEKLTPDSKSMREFVKAIENDYTFGEKFKNMLKGFRKHSEALSRSEKGYLEELYSTVTNAVQNGKKAVARTSLTQASKNEKAIDKQNKVSYTNSEVKENERSDEFRKLQKESRGMSLSKIQSYRNGSQKLSFGERKRISLVFGKEINADGSGRLYKQSSLVNPKSGQQITILENVDGTLFHDIFEISRNYLENGELVDLHDNYDDCSCFLSADGLSGFAIEKDGNLISVFNLGESGFLSTIKEYIIKRGATHLDGYNSIRQPLMLIYEKKLGFKTASIMDYNMEYDHDNIAENHGNPQVAFMVNTSSDIETKHFTKDQYDEAVAYQQSFIKKTDTKDVRFSVSDSVKEEEINRLADLKAKAQINVMDNLSKMKEYAKKGLIGAENIENKEWQAIAKLFGDIRKYNRATKEYEYNNLAIREAAKSALAQYQTFQEEL